MADFPAAPMGREVQRDVERDEAARALALDPARSILLEAPAGSGKTTVLARRFLRLLAVVDEPEQILAITFTRKAAGEMRERIASALRSADNELAQAALARSKARGWSLEAHPGRLRIQTIDSLNRWLASQLPLAARGAGGIDVMEAPDALYHKAARRALIDAEGDECLREDVERLFERLDNDFARFERLLIEMLRIRGHWLPVLLAGAAEGAPLHARGAELPARVEESLRAIVAERLRRASATIPRQLAAEGAWLAQEAAQRRARGVGAGRAAAMGSAVVSPTASASAAPAAAGATALATPAAAAVAEGRAPWRAWLEPPAPDEPLGLRHWQGLAQLALTAEGEWRRSLSKREGFPPEARALKARALDWIADLARIEGARDLLAELAALPQPALPEEDAAALASLARLLQLAASELAVVFAESGRVDFAHVAAAARQALAEEGAPTDLALCLGADIRHILVDEFQDTSIEQWKLLEALTAGWEEGDGRTLFVVGDPMQSIYQFREAEVGLFLRARTHGLGRLRLQPLALTRNFRALPEIISWLNEAFPRCFPPLDDARASAVQYRPCVAGRGSRGADEGAGGESGQQIDAGAIAEPGPAVDASAGAGSGPAVQVHAMPRNDPDAEPRAIVALIRELRARDPGASIAVLVASRAHAAPIAARLAAAGIAIAGVDLVPLGTYPVVRDLEALARALDHLADRTAWLAVLRAPWCGLTLSDLSKLLEETSGRTVWEAIHDAERVQRLDDGARARLIRTREALDRALGERDRLDPASWVEAAWLRLGGPAACREEGDLARAQAFLAHLARWSAEPGWAGPLAIADRLEALYAPQDDAAPGAVQIMTIHRAKGLEFDAVIVPSLGRKLRATAEPLLRWLELPREPQGTDLLMAAIPHLWRRGEEPLSEYLKALANRRAANERVRLLYVAATRARSALHLFAEPPSAGENGAAAAPAEGTLLAALWPAVAAELSGARAEASVGGEGQTRRSRSSLARLTADWRLPALPPAASAPEPLRPALEPWRPAPDPSQRTLEPRLGADKPCQAAIRVVCDQLRRCSREGRLPASPSGAAARMLRDRLMRLGLADEELEQGARRAAAMFEACIADPTLQWIFSAAHERAESPCRLAGLHADRLTSLTLDRTFVDAAGVRWIIQFGSTSHEASHGGSSEADRTWAETARFLARALGAEPVRAALYDPAKRELREPG